MNHTHKKMNKQEKIEIYAKELFNYDAESLLQEFELAQTQANKYLDEKIASGREADRTFEKLMVRIREDNIHPIYQVDFDAGFKEQKSIPLKNMPRLLLVFAALAVFLLAGSMLVFGERGYQFWEREKTFNTIWNNTDRILVDDSLENAYIEIEKHLGIKAMSMNYYPDNMQFQELIIDRGEASLRFLYNGKAVYFVQMNYLSDVTNGISKDSVKCGVVYNKVLDKEIALGFHELDNKDIEYCGELIDHAVRYYLYGVIEEEEMTKILKYWSFLGYCGSSTGGRAGD